MELRRQCLEVFHDLAAIPDTLVRKEDIVSAVWGQVAATDDSLTQCISEIRKALGDTERRILKTLPRRGYMSRRYYGTQPWPDDMAPYSQSDYARELIGRIEGLELGPVHVVSWSSGVRSAMRAVAERPDLFRCAIHYEPVDNGVFDGDASITALQSAWSVRWQSFGDALSANDLERAGELLIENVFVLPPGGYAQERELHKEVVRQNARTLPLEEIRSAEDPLISCGWLARVSVPTHFVGGADTHEYVKRMTRRFAECTPGSTLEFIADARHDGAVDKVDELSAIILGFVDAHR